MQPVVRSVYLLELEFGQAAELVERTGRIVPDAPVIRGERTKTTASTASTSFVLRTSADGSVNIRMPK